MSGPLASRFHPAHALAAEPRLAHPVFRGVRLAADDASAGLCLSAAAGWNQTEADWRLLLLRGEGFGFADAGGALAASAVVMPYGGRLAWIGMVLVAATARRQGLATLLVRHALERCRAMGAAPLLDATPAGRAVYLSLGFADLHGVKRWCRRDEAAAPGARGRPPSAIRPLRTDACAAWDAPHFGANRGFLLKALADARPDLALQLEGAHGGLRGYCLGRPGLAATQIGPVVAETGQDAVALVDAALAGISGPALADIPEGNGTMESALAARGFRAERSFTRMACGPGALPGRPSSIHAITGPEFG